MAIEKIEVGDQTQSPEELHNFYTAYYSGEVKIRFDKLKVLNLLRSLGYIWYVPETTDEAKKGMIIRIKNNRIRVVDIVNVQYALRDYIRKLPPITKQFLKKSYDEEGKSTMIPFDYTITPQLLEAKVMDNLANLFGGDLMYHLRVDESDGLLQIRDDTLEEKFMYFNNTVLRITADGVQEIDYKYLTGGCVWESSILDHDYYYTDETGDFEGFINDICGYDPTNSNKDIAYNGSQRKKSLMTILGYMMHHNYECTRRAIILTDVNEGDTEQANGRTGKGILGKALRETMNRKKSDCRYLSIPGKGFEFKDTRYSAGDISTQLIHIEDIDTKTFDFEQFFCDVTEGCLFRKLHQNPTTHDCKMMISTNHTINVLLGDSNRGRTCVFELNNYYTADFSPDMKYKRRFFESKWEERDWNQFYSFMVRCAAAYMKYGLIQPTMVNYLKRVIDETIPQDFTFFLEYHINASVKHFERMEINKREMYEKFVNKYPQYMKYQQSGFTKWCITYFQLMQIPSAHIRTTRNGDYVDLFVIYPDKGENVYKWIFNKKENKHNKKEE